MSFTPLADWELEEAERMPAMFRQAGQPTVARLVELLILEVKESRRAAASAAWEGRDL